MSKNRKFGNIFLNFLIHFVPGRFGTEVFVPGHLLMPLSRDKGTPGQEFFFVLGQRDNRTSRPDLFWGVPSCGNPIIDPIA